MTTSGTEARPGPGYSGSADPSPALQEPPTGPSPLSLTSVPGLTLNLREMKISFLHEVWDVPLGQHFLMKASKFEVFPEELVLLV